MSGAGNPDPAGAAKSRKAPIRRLSRDTSRGACGARHEKTDDLPTPLEGGRPLPATLQRVPKTISARAGGETPRLTRLWRRIGSRAGGDWQPVDTPDRAGSASPGSRRGRHWSNNWSLCRRRRSAHSARLACTRRTGRRGRSSSTNSPAASSARRRTSFGSSTSRLEHLSDDEISDIEEALSDLRAELREDD